MGRQGKSGKRLHPSGRELAITGAFVTIIFEQITNLGASITFGIPFLAAVISAIIPFSVVHVVSNAVIFAQVVPRLDTALREQLKDLIWNAESSLKVETLEYV